MLVVGLGKREELDAERAAGRRARSRAKQAAALRGGLARLGAARTATDDELSRPRWSRARSSASYRFDRFKRADAEDEPPSRRARAR